MIPIALTVPIALATAGLATSLLLAGAVIVAAAWMAENVIPGPMDEELLLQSTTTQTGSTNSAAIDMGAGFAPGGAGMPVAAVIKVTAADRTTGDETYNFKLQESADNVTFTDCGGNYAVPVSGNSATLGTLVAKGVLSRRYVRLASTLGGTTPSVTFKAWLVPLR